MAQGTYPAMLAGGVDNLGRYDQFDLYAGSADIVSSQAQVADGVAIQQFQVLALDVNGRITAWTGSEYGYASQTVTFTGNTANSETLTINGVVITFVTSGATGAQVNIGATAAATVQNLLGLINGTSDSVDTGTNMPVYGSGPLAGTGVTASVDTTGLVVTLSAIAPGTGGNAITLTEAIANATVGGATLAGGAAETTTDPVNAVGIAAQPIAAATPGAWIPYFTGGDFNHEALVWPAAVSTLAQRRRAFSGTNINVKQLL